MTKHKQNISVIIPCFNTNPEFIQEAIDSVKRSKGQYSYNIILVNDGSTNQSTLTFLKDINDKTINVISQDNSGLASAKNAGVRHSAGEYLFFLDSDDRVKPAYIQQGIHILDNNPKVGVVYANADVFGDSSRTNFVALPFNITSLLLQNHVPSCVIMRRKAWEDIGGFDENLRRYEDWECWINVYKSGWEFRLLEQAGFEYRIQKDSLLGNAGEKDFKQAIEYIFKKHWDLVYQQYYHLYGQQLIYKNDQQKPARSFIKYSKKKLFG